MFSTWRIIWIKEQRISVHCRTTYRSLSPSPVALSLSLSSTDGILQASFSAKQQNLWVHWFRFVRKPNPPAVFFARFFPVVAVESAVPAWRQWPELQCCSDLIYSGVCAYSRVAKQTLVLCKDATCAELSSWLVGKEWDVQQPARGRGGLEACSPRKFWKMGSS